MNKLNKSVTRIDGYTIKAVQFTEVTKEHMLAINKYLGAQAFQEKYIDDILDSYNYGYKLIPLFYRNGYASFIELKDWLYVGNEEVYATKTLAKVVDAITEIREEIEMTKDLNQLSKEVYEANKAKGFHEEEHSYEHMMCLVISELMEAVEADRKGHKADFENFNKQYEYSFKDNFDEYIKDTVEDELADAVIRLLDTAGALGVALDVFDYDFRIENKLFTENIFEIIYVIMSYNESYCISYAIDMIEGLCGSLNIDLWKHVELKLKFNSLRPYKHGKAY